MRSQDLGVNSVTAVPVTEGIKYAGSKRKLLPQILELVNRVHPRTVLDGFAGTTRVSQALAQTGYLVIANDVADWSQVFGTCYLLNRRPAGHYRPLIQHLNALPGRDGWFTEHYGGEPGVGASLGHDGLKKPWQKHNTRRLDAIRDDIDRRGLSPTEKAVALTSLMLALDEVDNTLGHFASYLNDWSPRSYHEMKLKVPRLIPSTADHEVHQADIFDLAPEVAADLAYLDPPYGSNNEKMPPSRVRYAAYYHLWTTICRHDRPALFGKVKRRADTSDTVAASVFEEFRKGKSGRFLVVEAIERLLQSVRARHIILSYSSGGRATAEALNQVIQSAGTLVEVQTIEHRRNVMAGMRWTNEWVKNADQPNREFLFLIEK
jgi:adenine-specific DNA-methyltransferase